MDINNFLSNLPVQVTAQLPSIPVFEFDEQSNGAAANLLTKGDLAKVLQSHNVTEAWFVPVRVTEIENEIAAECLIDVMATCVVNGLTYLEQYHVPDIKNGETLLPTILVLSPSNQQLAEITAMAGIDYIVHIGIDMECSQAETQAMDVIMVPMHNN